MNKPIVNFLFSFFILVTLCSLAQAGTGSIQGTVLDPSSNPIEDLRVAIYEASGSKYVTYAPTNSLGIYTITGLTPGNCAYKVQYGTAAYLNFHGIDYVDQWYNNKPDYANADCVDVIDGETTQLGTASLVLDVPGGSISGTVTGGGGPIENASVQAYGSDGNWKMTAFTENDGTYILSDLSTDNYTIKFNADTYIFEWYDNLSSQGSATSVPVTALNETENIDADLDAGSEISGIITDSCTGEGIGGAWINAYDATTEELISFTQTGNDGSYTVTGLPAGNYKLEFFEKTSLNAGIGYNEWYTDAANFATATEVSTGETGIDAILEDVSISGTVRNEQGEALENVTVYVHRAGSNPSGSDITAADGTYEVCGLRSGDYTIRFVPANDSGYENKWYDNEAVMSTNAPDDLTGIDTTLAIPKNLTPIYEVLLL